MPKCTPEMRWPSRPCPFLSRMGRTLREGFDSSTRRKFDRLFSGGPKNYAQSLGNRSDEQRSKMVEAGFYLKNNDPVMTALFVNEHAFGDPENVDRICENIGAKIVMMPQGDVKRVKGWWGNTIKEIRESTSATLLLQEDATAVISGGTEKERDAVVEMIGLIVNGPKVGKLYKGEITKVMEFGLFVKLSPGVEGLIHMNNIPNIERRVDLKTIFKPGDPMMVKVTSVEVEDRWGNHRIKLTADISEEELNNFDE